MIITVFKLLESFYLDGVLTCSIVKDIDIKGKPVNHYRCSHSNYEDEPIDINYNLTIINIDKNEGIHFRHTKDLNQAVFDIYPNSYYSHCIVHQVKDSEPSDIRLNCTSHDFLVKHGFLEEE